MEIKCSKYQESSNNDNNNNIVMAPKTILLGKKYLKIHVIFTL